MFLINNVLMNNDKQNLPTKRQIWCFVWQKLKISIGWRGSNQKSNLHYTRGITPNRVASGGAHLPGLAPGLHSSEETSQRWRAGAEHCADLTDPGIEPQTSRTESVRLATELTAGRLTGNLNFIE